MELMRSDVGSNATAPDWWQWTSVQFAHAFLGVLAALLPTGVACVLFAAFIVKELTGDIAHAHGEFIVVLDALSDLLAAWCGWRLGQWMKGMDGFYG